MTGVEVHRRARRLTSRTVGKHRCTLVTKRSFFIHEIKIKRFTLPSPFILGKISGSVLH